MPGTVDDEISHGFCGKIPARGDFVQGGLPRDFVEPWLDWQNVVISGSREVMGDTWLDSYLEAPVWRFILPAGFCGHRAAIGLIMPSVDRVGRYFPLTFAAVSTHRPLEPDAWLDWLTAAEDLGRLALDEDAPPDRLNTPRPPTWPTANASTAPATSTWWTDGGPRVEATRLSLSSLPGPARFASMLGHLASTESAS